LVDSPGAPELSRIRLWWLAARPATLAASVAPVLAAVALATAVGRVRAWAGVAALLVALAIQVGVNYANDYSDHRRGADRERRGPVRAAASGLVSPGSVRLAAIIAFAIAAVSGLALSLLTDPRLIFLGAAAILAAWLYTGGPRPYGYIGLGEVFTFIFFGLVATAGTVYVLLLQIPPETWWLASALGCMACAILGVNNLRDIESDRRAGKMTLAARLGRRGTRVEVGLLLGVGVLAPVVAALLYHRPFLLLALLAAPLGLRVVIGSGETEPARLVGALRQTAAMELWLALLIALGLLI